MHIRTRQRTLAADAVTKESVMLFAMESVGTAEESIVDEILAPNADLEADEADDEDDDDDDDWDLDGDDDLDELEELGELDDWGSGGDGDEEESW